MADLENNPFVYSSNEELIEAAAEAGIRGDTLALAALSAVADSRVERFKARLESARTVQSVINRELENVAAEVRVGE